MARRPEDRFADAGEARIALRMALGEAQRVDSSTKPSIPPFVPESAGPQPPGAAYDPRWYVPREIEEREVLNAISYAGKPAVLWGPFRFGKTWLLDHCLEQAARRFGFESVKVHAKLLDRGSLDGLLRGLALRIAEARDLPLETLNAIWERPDGPSGKLTRFLERQVLPSVRTALVLAIDAADEIWGAPPQEDFAGLLRAWAERCDEPWSRLRLMLTVSTTPALLVQDPNRSPFNLSAPIVLGDLRVEEVEGLARRYGLSWTRTDVQEIMSLVGGHPQLVRLIMHRAALHATPLSELLDVTRGSNWVLHQDVRRVRAWLKDSSLLSVASRVARDASARLDTDDHQRLLRAGIVVEKAPGTLALRNRLYELAVSEVP